MAVKSSTSKKEIPHGLWTKCKKCEQIIFNKDLEGNLKVCPKCGYYFRLNARERINMLSDAGTFTELDADMLPGDPLGFPDYAKRSRSYKVKEALVSGVCEIDGCKTAIAVMDFDFMGGSMGSVVGEKITRACEHAIENKLPFIIVSSSGGARMQEGIYSLMQMAKTSAALARLSDHGLAFISLLTDPTTGGVSASYAMLGDVIVAEPKALIGFAGPRVIEQTIRQKLPEGFQLSEFVLEHGMVDVISERKDMKNTIANLLKFFTEKMKKK
ncbi:MAG TPA: acetyl-CoA carboxylase carboxyl transferase subunit beta [Elusimicrobia bacterium]|nr:MAG: acetyl-CoA carboxylase subunit beta [Elusimicrobia bacterium RIFOXYA12_FULL_49_49]OGS09329.1 MAG: acetyl-CoA carboxylase subunit beta [Elusimicrobia bacterium RIFOXYB1_FULL_48_9]OGS09800.1 MAG: acetyl-CoA carboxylase subunit beta [Elusimicrobia bacterium RIFOXYA1_FULL_47_7]OGS16835.1 MAG: acetyl-CoA carboxylase subunit beta [Elusimicrobia bacterium RIFOXYA2_FULL_47_53]OGS32063.1 MAG: acetyl-CoA carboxylase subunit beta [Elusimicrobia bacterium RIFOXYB2_FULL_46_23]HBU69956.1 acetyl-CoA 